MLALWLPRMEYSALYLKQVRRMHHDEVSMQQGEEHVHEGGEGPVALVAGVTRDVLAPEVVLEYAPNADFLRQALEKKYPFRVH
jgi:hypothetical protein